MSEELPVASGETDKLEQMVLGAHGAPAYVRRARAVQDRLDEVLAACRRQREEWTEMARLRLGELSALCGDWNALLPLLAGPEQIAVLQKLFDELRPALRVPIEVTQSRSVLRRALTELTDSLERFNRRWPPFLARIDLTAVNVVRDNYNRYYILEKECAVRSPAVARMGFVRLEPLTTEDLLRMVPLLPVPRSAS